MTDHNRMTMKSRASHAVVALAVFGLLLGLAEGGRRVLWERPDPGSEATRPDAGSNAHVIAPALAALLPPVAEAGFDRTVAVGDTVVLDGSGSRLAHIPTGSTTATGHDKQDSGGMIRRRNAP